MKQKLITLLAVITIILSMMVWSHFFGDAQVETFVVHTIEAGDTPQSIVDKYNGGGVDSKYANELMLLNPSQEFEVGVQIQVPVFKH